MNADKYFPRCPSCGALDGFDVVVYLQVVPGTFTDAFGVGQGGSGITCQDCGEDISDAGMINEFDHPFLTAVRNVLEYCTARDAIREGLDGITCLRQEEE